jgi:hypothetical protein
MRWLALGLFLLAGYVWLIVWAANRTERFYRATEDRRWDA